MYNDKKICYSIYDFTYNRPLLRLRMYNYDECKEWLEKFYNDPDKFKMVAEDEHHHGFYTMSDYINDLKKGGEWDHMTEEQQNLIIEFSKK